MCVFSLLIFESYSVSAQCLSNNLNQVLLNYIEYIELAKTRENCTSNEKFNCSNILKFPTKCTIPRSSTQCKLISYNNMNLNCITIEYRRVDFNTGLISLSTGTHEYKFIATSDSVAFEFKAVNSLEEYNMILKYCETNQEAVNLIDSIYHIFDIQTIKKLEINQNQDMISITEKSHSTPDFILYFRKGKVYKILAP